MATPVDLAPTHDRELVLARLMDATPNALFRCWTEAALLSKWFAPAPLTTEVRECDARPGGRQDLLMRDGNGGEYPSAGVYLEIIPDKKLVFTDGYQRAWVPSEKSFMTATITFEAQGDRTLYVARVGHPTLADKAQHEAMGFQGGWGLCADQLEALARTL